MEKSREELGKESFYQNGNMIVEHTTPDTTQHCQTIRNTCVTAADTYNWLTKHILSYQ